MRVLTAAAAILVLAAVVPDVGSAGDSLSLHERVGISGKIYKRAGCVDCERAPDMRTARWKFASDYGEPKSVQIAYVVVAYASLDKKRHAMLFGYDSFSAQWIFMGEAGGSNVFLCGTNVLVYPNNYKVVEQLKVLRRVARCA